MTTNGEVHQVIGELKGRMDGLESVIKRLNIHADQNSKDMKEVLKFMNTTKGAKKMLLGLVGTGAIVGIASTKLIELLFK